MINMDAGGPGYMGPRALVNTAPTKQEGPFVLIECGHGAVSFHHPIP
jgi:hypothetical protein